MIDRRAMLAKALGGGLAVMAARPALAAGDGVVGGRPSLDAIARTRGLRFGSALSHWQLDNAPLRNLVAAQCGVITPENELKWKAVDAQAGAETFGPADQLLAFATADGLEMRGHNLVWQNQKWLPDWVKSHDFGAQPVKAAEDLLAIHIRDEISRYRGRIRSWDVVNETIDQDTGELRQTVLTKAMGDRVIDFAFQVARAVDPSAQLVYNDYMSWERSSAKHRAGVLRLLERLKKNNVPVDALGLQSHIKAGAPGAAMSPADPTAWRAFLDEVTGMGYSLLITELDVSDKALPADLAVRDAASASYAKDYLDLTLSYRQVSQVITWGLVDRYSWLQTEVPRPDHLESRCLPYDDSYQPTPLRQAIAAALAAAPPRG